MAEPGLPVPSPLPDALVELIARRFRALGEPMRIRLLDALRRGPLTVNELAETLGANQQNVSKHVGVLAQAGFIRRDKAGNRVRCLISDDSVFELCELICGNLRQQVADLDQLLTHTSPAAMTARDHLGSRTDRRTA